MDSTLSGASGDEEQGTCPPLNSCSSATSIHDLMPELLETIFQHLSAKDLKSSRLVCSKWNVEIMAHVPHSLIVDVGPVSSRRPTFTFQNEHEPSSQEFDQAVADLLNFYREAREEAEKMAIKNVEFIHKINKVKSLHLVNLARLRASFYTTLLKEHQQKRLEQLKISCPIQDSFIQLVLQPYTSNLKVLEISDVALNNCDFEKGWSNIPVPAAAGAGNPLLFLPNLQQFTQFQENTNDEWRLLNGKEVQLNSKNMTFLLRHISSVRMKVLRIKFNTSLRRVNSCTGRREYRFEDMDLQALICKNGKHLVKLDLHIPLSMPKKRGVETPKSLTTPTSLNSMKLEISTGNHFERNVLMINNELLDYERSFYDNHAAETNFFWNTLSLAQTQLKNYEITLRYDLSPTLMENIYKIVEKNKNTLKRLWVSVWLADFWQDPQINGAYFEGTKLSTLNLSTIILGTPPPGPIAPDAYRFTNFHLLPTSITKLRLVNTKLEREDFVFLATNLTSLKHIDYLFKFPHLYNLGAIEGFAPIVDGFIKQCTSYCRFGVFGNIVDDALRELLSSLGRNYREHVLDMAFGGGHGTHDGEGGGGDDA